MEGPDLTDGGRARGRRFGFWIYPEGRAIGFAAELAVWYERKSKVKCDFKVLT